MRLQARSLFTAAIASTLASIVASSTASAEEFECYIDTPCYYTSAATANYAAGTSFNNIDAGFFRLVIGGPTVFAPVSNNSPIRSEYATAFAGFANPSPDVSKPDLSGRFNVLTGGQTKSTALGTIDSFSLEVDAFNTAQSIATVNYYFRAEGGPIGTRVPYKIHTSGYALTTGGDSQFEAFAESSVTVRDFTAGGFALATSYVSANSTFSPGANVYDDVFYGFVTTGNIYEVTVATVANTFGIGYAEAYADPTFEVDPDFAAANPGFRFAFAGSLLSSSPTPEPAAWALMIGGFGLVGGRLRRRRPAGRGLSL